MFYVSFIVSCFTCDTLVIALYYEIIHGICFYFLYCEIKNFLLVYLYFTHMGLCTWEPCIKRGNCHYRTSPIGYWGKGSNVG